MKAAKTNPGITVASGAIAVTTDHKLIFFTLDNNLIATVNLEFAKRICEIFPKAGRPAATIVIAAMGTPTTMLASMCLLVDMGMSWIMSMVLVIMSLLSVLLWLSAGVVVWFRSIGAVVVTGDLVV